MDVDLVCLTNFPNRSVKKKKNYNQKTSFSKIKILYLLVHLTSPTHPAQTKKRPPCSSGKTKKKNSSWESPKQIISYRSSLFRGVLQKRHS